MKLKRLAIVPVLLLAAVVAAGCEENYQSAGSNQIGVVRGAPTDTIDSETEDRKIKSYLCPEEKRTDAGQDVEVRYYPEKTNQRYYTVDGGDGTKEGGLDRGDRPGPDFLVGETADGVELKVEGKFYFNTNFDCSDAGKKLLTEFDTQYGSRSFPVPGQGGTDQSESAIPSAGAKGWDAFLDTNMRDDLDGVVNQLIKEYTCADLKASCSVVTQNKTTGIVDPNQGKATGTATQEFEKELLKRLNEKLQKSMGQEYLTFTDFTVTKVNLPGKVQTAINNAQESYAKLGDKEAELRSQELDAKIKAAENKTFIDNPALVPIRLAELENERFKMLLDAESSGKIDTLNYGLQPRK